MKRRATGEAKLFLEIWEEREHKCFLTGIPLTSRPGTSFWFSYFAHVLNKKDYPEYRLYKPNILLLHPAIHTLYDHPEMKKVLRVEEAMDVSFADLFRYADKLRERYIRETGKQRYQRKFVLEYYSRKNF